MVGWKLGAAARRARQQQRYGYTPPRQRRSSLWILVVLGIAILLTPPEDRPGWLIILPFLMLYAVVRFFNWIINRAFVSAAQIARENEPQQLVPSQPEAWRIDPVFRGVGIGTIDCIDCT